MAGIAYTATAIPAQTELQEEIPPAVRGRVFGILNMLVSVGSFLPIILVGYVSDWVGTMPVLLGAAALIFIVGVASLVARSSPPPGSLSDEQAEPVVAARPGRVAHGAACPAVARRAVSRRPRVAVVFTGGTISMTVDPVAGGAVPTLAGADLLAAVPGLDRRRRRRRDRPRADAGQPLLVRRRAADPGGRRRGPRRPGARSAWSSCRGPTRWRRRPSPGTSATATGDPWS